MTCGRLLELACNPPPPPQKKKKKNPQPVLLWVVRVPCGRYKDMWRHLDGTVAYFTGSWHARGMCTTDCAMMTSTGFYKTQRDQPDFASFLCELPPPLPSPAASFADRLTKGQLVSLSPLDVASAWANRSAFLECPLGHVTHTFLAHDEQSSCWAPNVGGGGDGGGVSPFPAGLTPLPPPFTCDNGVQHVPYTLLCDHRPDCSDQSDEQFCIFSPCDVSTQFECTDRAVRTQGLSDSL